MRKTIFTVLAIAALAGVPGETIGIANAHGQEVSLPKRDIPSLEECISQNLEFMTAITEEFQGNFGFGFKEEDADYSFMVSENKTSLTLKTSINGVPTEYRIYCYGGLFSEIEGVKITGEWINQRLADYHLTGSGLIGFNVVSIAESHGIPEKTEQFKHEIQEVLYSALAKLFERCLRESDYLNPKIMPMEYFNQMGDDLGLFMRIVDTYGQQDVHDESAHYTRRVLSPILDGAEYYISVDHSFKRRYSHIYPNEKLRKDCKITIFIYRDSEYTVNDEPVPRKDFIRLDPVTGEIIGATLDEVSYFNREGKTLGEMNAIIEQGLEYTRDNLSPEILLQHPNALARLNKARDDVNRVMDYLRQTYQLE